MDQFLFLPDLSDIDTEDRNFPGRNLDRLPLSRIVIRRTAVDLDGGIDRRDLRDFTDHLLYAFPYLCCIISKKHLFFGLIRDLAADDLALDIAGRGHFSQDHDGAVRLLIVFHIAEHTCATPHRHCQKACGKRVQRTGMSGFLYTEDLSDTGCDRKRCHTLRLIHQNDSTRSIIGHVLSRKATASATIVSAKESISTFFPENPAAR